MQLVQVNKEEPGLSFPLPSSLGELTSCSWLHETGSPGRGMHLTRALPDSY